MTVKRVLAAAVGGVLFAAAGVAAAGNFASDRQVDYFSRGTHQFFVWCGKGNDYLTTAEGTNAEDAQMKLYGDIKKDGKLPCWPVWQGRISAKAN